MLSFSHISVKFVCLSITMHRGGVPLNESAIILASALNLINPLLMEGMSYLNNFSRVWILRNQTRDLEHFECTKASG